MFVGLQLKVFKPREFYSIETFRRWSYLFTRTHTDVKSHCEKGCSGRCLFYFQCSIVDIYKYKGKYLLRRIPHASHRSFSSFVIPNIVKKNTSMGIHQLRYVALRFPLTTSKDNQYFCNCASVLLSYKRASDYITNNQYFSLLKFL